MWGGEKTCGQTLLCVPAKAYLPGPGGIPPDCMVTGIRTWSRMACGTDWQARAQASPIALKTELGLADGGC